MVGQDRESLAGDQNCFNRHCLKGSKIYQYIAQFEIRNLKIKIVIEVVSNKWYLK